MWFSVGVVVLQGWAGFELVRMSPHSRIIATVFGIVSARGHALHLLADDRRAQAYAWLPQPERWR